MIKEKVNQEVKHLLIKVKKIKVKKDPIQVILVPTSLQAILLEHLLKSGRKKLPWGRIILVTLNNNHSLLDHVDYLGLIQRDRFLCAGSSLGGKHKVYSIMSLLACELSLTIYSSISPKEIKELENVERNAWEEVFE